jgi:hypothetical protein
MARQVADRIIHYDPRHDEYGIVLRQDPLTVKTQKIDFCPWSGDRLPQSQRSRWFDELEAKGIDPMNDEIPEEYQSDAWRLKH